VHFTSCRYDPLLVCSRGDVDGCRYVHGCELEVYNIPGKGTPAQYCTYDARLVDGQEVRELHNPHPTKASFQLRLSQPVPCGHNADLIYQVNLGACLLRRKKAT
jgi:hypothetical protein